MDNKTAGIDYDRQVFAPSAQQPAATPSAAGIFFFVAVIAAILALGYVGYKGFVQSSGGSSTADLRALNEMQQRVAALEERLVQAEKENHRRSLAASQSSQNAKNDTPAAPAQSSAHSASRTSYRISGSTAPQPSRPAAPDNATAQKLAGIQQGLGALQNDATSNREAWQATTDKLADVAGQVGVQSR